MKIEGLTQMLAEIQHERGISKEVLLDAICASLVSACKKRFKTIDNLEGTIDDDGVARIFAKKEVITKVEDPELQITKAEAKKVDPKVKTGDTVKIEVTPSDFGRLAAQTAKQVIIQRIREAEKENTFEEFSKKDGSLITGTVQRKEPGGYLINLGRIETILPNSETIYGEILRPQEHVRLYVIETKKTPRGPLVMVSRSHPDLVKRLFELEVPEIKQGILEIKVIAREAGRRTKVAVFSNDKNIGAVGTCVGHMGSRIQNIVKELGNERVDIIEWNDEPAIFIANSLSPAKIIKVRVNREDKEAAVIVPEKDLSLAIGKEGQNVRLAAKLSGWKIDIISETEDAKERGDEKGAEEEEGEETKEEIKKVKVHELAKELGMTSKDLVKALNKMNIDAKAANSVVPDDKLDSIRSNLSGKKSAANKIKVNVLAKELGLKSKDLLVVLKELSIEAKTSASSILEEEAKKVREEMATRGGSRAASTPETKPVQKKKPKFEEFIIQQKVGRGDRHRRKTTTAKSSDDKGPAKVEQAEVEEETLEPQTMKLPPNDIMVKDLAIKLEIKLSELIKALMKKSILANVNQLISVELAQEVALEFNRIIEIEESGRGAAAQVEITGDLIHRPPIVTIMGHVDHGKTKLLDAIRSSKIVEGEAGGITQHIGAYQVDVHGKKVTFLDTPGHEAFTALRARGAQVTDIAILVVAADDGVKPQTIEAIDHVRAAGVPIIVAINKIDKPDSNLDRVKQQLSDHDLLPEEWGGKTVTVPVSAIKKQGINDLLEMVLLVADVEDLKADPKAKAAGVVVESKLDKQRGPVATVLIKNGTLSVGDPIVIGHIFGKVRAMLNDHGARMKSAGPSMPVEILGLSEVPIPGDLLEKMPGEKHARQLAEKRKAEREVVRHGKVLSLEDFSKHIKEGEAIDLNLVIKADVQGSLEALLAKLKDFSVQNIKCRVIHSGVGAVNESDVMLALASGAILTAFHVEFNDAAKKMAEHEGVETRQYNIIYKLLEDIESAMKGMLEPVFEEVVMGHAEVRQTFKFSKVGVIAGSFVTDGYMQRGAKVRIIRDEKVIHEGKIDMLKRFKDDAKKVEQNYECGIALQGYTDFKVGDKIEAFEMREKK